MTNSRTPLGALELLQQYNDHRLQKDKVIEYIEDNVIEPDQTPSYDALVEENKELKKKLKDQKNDIDRLNQYIEDLEDKLQKNNAVTLIHNDTDTVLLNTSNQLSKPIPTRSNNRTTNRKILNSSVTPLKLNESDDVKHSLTSNFDIENTIDSALDDMSPDPTRLHKTHDNINLSSPNITGSNKSSSSVLSASEQSLKLTKGEISPLRPRSPMRDRLESPQRANRVTAVINNHIHSPLTEIFSTETDISFFDQSKLKFFNDTSKTSLDQLKKSELTNNSEFSPSSKAKINDFTELLDHSFLTGSTDLKFSNPLSIDDKKVDGLVKTSPTAAHLNTDAKLSSPVILSKPTDFKRDIGQQFLSIPSIEDKAYDTNTNKNRASPLLSSKMSRSPSLKSLNGDNIPSVKSPAESNHIPLFVEPQDFGTIKLTAISTLYIDQLSSSKERLVLISVVDRNTDKEIFRFAKSFYKIFELNNQLRSMSGEYSLPPLPDNSLFDTLTPLKVYSRLAKINAYLSSLFNIPTFSGEIGLLIARFISTDTVINPESLHDSSKEGYLLTRRQKTLSSTQPWKVNYAVLHDNILDLLEDSTIKESTNINNTTIESIHASQDNKYGTIHGFQIVEHKGGLSSNNKYYMCAETAAEKSEWINILDSVSNKSQSKSSQSSTIDQASLADSFEEKTKIPLNSHSPISPSKSPEQCDRKEQKKGKRSFFPFKRSMGILSPSPGSEEALPTESDEINYFISNPITSSHNFTRSKGIFGLPIEEAVKLSSHKLQNKYEIPSIVYRCLEFIYTKGGLQEQGIFRLSGSSALVRILQDKFNTDHDINLCTYLEESESTTSNIVDVNTAASLLKLYLRNLPHLIFGDEFYSSFKNAAESSNSPSLVALEFKKLIQSPSMSNSKVALMYALFELLKKTSENNKINKMNLKNICIVFSPTLNIPIDILQPFIVDFDCIFKDGKPISDNERVLIDVDIPQLS
ncbi:hypothetical protein TPHA_0A01140 [Tetrapisispora phaffii CBS 4417]|uniref:Rho-GAP domain-containing protein n=1 Tax=Tetrapisispora phaffii (strain ATCC 24235 / CBS 4417 / NBRC 1672 / NRRL Y-8282 / UCD 70-5) TaxID=1071381 RepID=G8BMS0_TETPH|nr:hypothetical protein TPHA_0A01140 [Tetrapisispora phaffii CBS 4417]CCE61198.1 hypothetical protein TPHA_0A01140 [Tetrapisispora phaffii CBS 4417]